MYQVNDIYNPDLTKKDSISPINVHILHQRRDQITGVEQRKSLSRKKKRDMIARVNLNTRNREIAALAQAFLQANKPIQYGENAASTSLA